MGQNSITMMIKSYQDLIVWQKAMELVISVYEVTRNFPREERYGLSNQLRRAAVSIPSNIAEGHARKSRAAYRNFLSIASGSLAEVETQIILARKLGYMDQATMEQLRGGTTEIGKMLNTLLQKLAPNP